MGKQCKRWLSFLCSLMIAFSSMAVYAADEETVHTFPLLVSVEGAGKVKVSADRMEQKEDNQYVMVAGSRVDLQINPDEGYELSSLTLEHGDEKEEVKDNHFFMPANDTTLKVMFQEKKVDQDEAGTNDRTVSADEQPIVNEETGTGDTATGAPVADGNNSVQGAEQPKETENIPVVPVSDSAEVTAPYSSLENQLDKELEEKADEAIVGRMVSRRRRSATTTNYYIGQVFSGSCYIASYYTSGNYSTFTVTNFSGELSDAYVSGSLHCLDPTAAEPHGVGASYRATVSRIDKTNGRVYYNVVITPPGVTDGVTRNEYGLIGNQRVGGEMWANRKFKGKLWIQKSSTEAVDNPSYNLDGAVFGVYSNESCTQEIGTLSIWSGSGYSHVSSYLEVPQGYSYVKEITPGKGYKLNPQVYKVWVDSGTEVRVDVPNEPEKGKAKLKKVSANPGITDGNSCYSLAGAVYGIYSDAECQREVSTFTTDASGESAEVDLFAAHYWVKEKVAPKGYLLDTDVYEIDVQIGQTAVLNVSDRPANDPIQILLGKIDRETNKNKPQGSASLENAEFTVKYYDRELHSVDELEGLTPLRSWVFKTNEKGVALFLKKYFVSGDAFYYDALGGICIPIGTITIQETKAPEGYLLNDEIFIRNISQDEIGGIVRTYNQPIIPEQVIRGNVRFIKYGENSAEMNDSHADVKKSLKGVTFHLTHDVTGEVVSVETDDDGVADTSRINPEGALLYGWYTVTEENPYSEYDPIKPFKIFISEDKRTLSYIIRNDTADTLKCSPQKQKPKRLLQ